MPVPELPEIDEEFSEGSRIEFGKEHLEVIHLPGHSPGHCGFIADEISLCLVGDACFASAAGRCDLWLGNEFEQERTLDRIQRLPASWTLLPGHGDAFVPAAVAKARFQRSTNF
jgi:hydroxyacylglutathione hydrolase